MQFPQHLLLLIFLGYGVLAASAPIQSQKRHGSFKVDRVRRDGYIPHGPTALHMAYRKYGIVPRNMGVDQPDFEPSSLTKRAETGFVSATLAKGGSEFVSPVKIGGQTILMDFDTGSSDIWVVNTGLPHGKIQGHTAFDPSKSSSWEQMEGASFNVKYGDASFTSGHVGTDTVDIGGAVAKKQAIGLPTVISDSFAEDSTSNGLVGLAFSKLNTIKPEKQKTFIENVAKSLDEPLMTALLKDNNSGEYEFGTIDHKKYKGELKNISVDASGGFWQFDSAKFAVGDENAETQDIKNAPTAIADTGTSLMLVSDEVAEAYYSKVEGAVQSNGAGGFVYPCSAKLPDLSVDLGGKGMATIHGSDITFSEAGTNGTTGQKLCLGGIQSNQDSNVQVYGDVFLRSMFVVFDMRGPSLGMAVPA